MKELTTREYIDASQGTIDCMLLFIPNEQVYAFIQEQDRDALDDALRSKIVFCSPLTLYAVLAVIRQAVDNFQLERTSQEILNLLVGFEKQWDRFVEQMDKVGRNLRTAARRSTSSKPRGATSSNVSSTRSTSSGAASSGPRTRSRRWRSKPEIRRRGRRSGIRQ